MSKEFLEYLLSLLEPSGGITSRSMFGGYMIYKNGIAIAIVAGSTAYFKVNEANRSDFEVIESAPFTYETRSKTIALSYWSLPLEILEDTTQLLAWTERSYRVAVEARHRKIKKPSREKNKIP